MPISQINRDFLDFAIIEFAKFKQSNLIYFLLVIFSFRLIEN